MKTTASGRPSESGRRPARFALLAGLLGLGLFQVASFAYFLSESRDFLLAQAATSMAAGEIAVPGEVFLPRCLGPQVPCGTRTTGCFACLRSGWGGPFRFGVMSQRRDAVIALMLPVTARTDGRDLILVLDAAAYAPPALGKRHLKVAANGTPVAELEFPAGDPRTARFISDDESFLHRIAVPHAIAAERSILLLTLQMAVASPRQLGLGSDPRPMGFAVRKVGLYFEGDDATAAATGR